MTVTYIELNKLVKSPLNVRRTASKTACEELKASILAHGLMQNLVVVPGQDGTYEVIAGARRLEAIRDLVNEGKLRGGDIPCQVVTNDHAAEMSLAENTIRAAMHPADEFEAFAALVDGGMTAAKIAVRFGTSEKHVLQRLKLGRVAPELLAEYRAENLDLECLMAFTVTDDQKRQVEIYGSLQGWQRNDPSHIRRCLMDKATSGKDKLAKFVTLEAYEASGGTVRRDLFGENVYLEDTALLHRLAGEKLEAEAERLRLDGWGWVELDFEIGYETLSKFARIKPEPLDAPSELVAELGAAEAQQTRIAEQIDKAYDSEEENQDEIERLEEEATAIEDKIAAFETKLEGFVAFDPEAKKHAGCFIGVSWGGELKVEMGLVKRSDAKKVATAQGVDSGDDEDDDQPAAKPKGMSDSLRPDLEAYRLAAAQAEIASNPAIAFDLLVFKAAKSVCSISHAYDGPQISFNSQSAGTASADARESIAKQMGAIKRTLPLDWQEHDNEADQFAAFQRLTSEQKHSVLAFCIARTLQPKLATDSRYPTAYDIALSQTGANVADYWRPTKDNYLGRITSPQLLEIGQEIFGGNFASQYAKSKKAELAALLDKGFANPQKALDPEKVRRLASWLPEGMAFLAIEPAEEVESELKPGRGRPRKNVA